MQESPGKTSMLPLQCKQPPVCPHCRARLEGDAAENHSHADSVCAETMLNMQSTRSSSHEESSFEHPRQMQLCQETSHKCQSSTWKNSAVQCCRGSHLHCSCGNRVSQNKPTQHNLSKPRSCSFGMQSIVFLVALVLNLLSPSFGVQTTLPSLSQNGYPLKLSEGILNESSEPKFLHLRTWTSKDLENDVLLPDNSSKSSKIKTIPDKVAVIGKLFHYELPAEAFSTMDVTDYKATQAGLSSLPNWLYFNETSGVLIGIPVSDDKGKVYISIEARGHKMRRKISENAVFAIYVSPMKLLETARSIMIKDSRNTSEASPSCMKAWCDGHIHNESLELAGLCVQDELSIIVNMLFLVNFQVLSPQERAALFCTASTIAGISPGQLFLRKIDPSKPDDIAVWSKIWFNPELAGYFQYATIIAFRIGCTMPYDLSDITSQYFSHLDEPLMQPKNNVSSYDQWFVSVGASITMHSTRRKRSETAYKTHQVSRRQVNDIELVDEPEVPGNLNIVTTKATSSTSFLSTSRSRSTLDGFLSLSLLPNIGQITPSSNNKPPTRVIPVMGTSIYFSTSNLDRPQMFETVATSIQTLPSSEVQVTLSDFEPTQSLPIMSFTPTMISKVLSTSLFSLPSIPISIEVLTTTLDFSSSMQLSSVQATFSVASTIQEPTSVTPTVASTPPVPTIQINTSSISPTVPVPGLSTIFDSESTAMFFTSLEPTASSRSVSLLMPMSTSELLTMPASSIVPSPTSTIELTFTFPDMTTSIVGVDSLSLFPFTSSSIAFVMDTSVLLFPTTILPSTPLSSVMFSPSLRTTFISTPIVDTTTVPPLNTTASFSIQLTTTLLPSLAASSVLDTTFFPPMTTEVIFSTDILTSPSSTLIFMPFSTSTQLIQSISITTGLVSSSEASSPTILRTPPSFTGFESSIFPSTSFQSSSFPPSTTDFTMTTSVLMPISTPGTATPSQSVVLTTQRIPPSTLLSPQPTPTSQLLSLSSSVEITTSTGTTSTRTTSTPELTSSPELTSEVVTVSSSTISLRFSTPTTFTPTPTPSPVSICDVVDCGNGSCIDDFMMFRCECYPGWTGQFCNVDIDDCAGNLCQNQTSIRCEDGNNTFTCICEPGFSGIFCEADLTPCDPDPCNTNETCFDRGKGTFVCIPRPGSTTPLLPTLSATVSPVMRTTSFTPLPTTTFTSSSSLFADRSTSFVSPIPTSVVDFSTSIISSSSLTSTQIFTTPVPTTTMLSPSLSVSPSVSPSPSPTPTPNNPPLSLNPVGTIIVNEGQVFRFLVPDNTFYDPESGLASNLTLSLSDSFGEPIPNNTWVQIVGQVIEGIPLQVQVQSRVLTDYVFLLRAEDDQGNVAHSFVTIRVNPRVSLLNFLVVIFEGDFMHFGQNLSAKIDIVIQLAVFSGLPEEMAIRSIYIESFRSGSIGVSYNNLSISDFDCADFRAWVETIFNNGQYTDRFVSSLMPYIPISMPLIEGQCNSTTVNIPPNISTVDKVNSQFQSSRLILISVMVPASFIGLVLAVTGVAAFILYRRHRKERDELVDPGMRRAFLNRYPVILSDEVDLTTRRRAPVIIANDFVGNEEVDNPEMIDSSSDEELLDYSLMLAQHRSRQIQARPPLYQSPPRYPS